MIHLRNHKLEAGIYSNSYILPYNLLGTPCLGGVTLGDGRYVKDSTWTEWDDLSIKVMSSMLTVLPFILE